MNQWTTKHLMGLAGWAIVIGVLIAAAVIIAPAIKIAMQEPVAAIEPLPASRLTQRTTEHRDLLASGLNRVRDRSPFAPKIVEAPPAPPVPVRYGGPAVVGVAGGKVYFADGRRIIEGEENDGLKVLGISAPWTVRLGWSNGEYDVTLLERNPVRFDQSPSRDALFRMGTTPAQPAASPSSQTPASVTPPATTPAPSGS